jgi:hypothetical protein
MALPGAQFDPMIFLCGWLYGNWGFLNVLLSSEVILTLYVLLTEE